MKGATTEISHALHNALINMDRLQAQAILDGFNNTHGPARLVEQVIAPAMEMIGHGWEQGELALSQIYMSSRICSELAESIVWTPEKKPYPQPKMAIVVLEDYHMLGKQMMYSAMRASGYDLLDYRRMDVDTLVQRVAEDRIELLLISTLMLRAALRIKSLREALQAQDLKVALLVGGAPFRFDKELYRTIGADAVAHTISEAIRTVRSLS
ncbi:MAG: cobalamin-dependent protein [Magnetococcales bacterium]|nr:cobalamin-dependent protein [Magnetococcales bacterium]